MIAAGRSSAPGAARAALIRSNGVPAGAVFGRSAVYRRLLSQTSAAPRALSQQSTHTTSRTQPSVHAPFLQTAAVNAYPPWHVLPARRAFGTTSVFWQEQQQKQSETSEKSESSSNQESKQEEKKQDSEQENSSQEGEKKKKEEAPPPPPHGDKTPWQVFTETLQKEFKASKEWNESTKALASSAHQFSESESVKRARAAYEAASTATTSKTSSALKKTGKALGQGAAWTWDTSVVKGIRYGVSATGKGIEKATRPVRETKAYKAAVGEVKDVMDDGSSSRYGGWIEKEERRKQRELRELNEAKAGKSHKVEKMEEDPK